MSAGTPKMSAVENLPILDGVVDSTFGSTMQDSRMAVLRAGHLDLLAAMEEVRMNQSDLIPHAVHLLRTFPGLIRQIGQDKVDKKSPRGWSHAVSVPFTISQAEEDSGVRFGVTCMKYRKRQAGPRPLVVLRVFKGTEKYNDVTTNAADLTRTVILNIVESRRLEISSYDGDSGRAIYDLYDAVGKARSTLNAPIIQNVLD